GMMVTGVVLAVHWVTFFQSIQVGGVALGLISYATFPMFVIFLDPLFTRNRIQRRDVVVAVVTIVGAVLVVPAFDLANDVTRGFAWGLVSSSTFALLSILNKISVADYSGLVVALYQDAVAMVVLIPALFLAEYTLTVQNVALLVLLGVVFTAIAHSLFIQGLREVRAQTASIIASLESVYGIVFAFVFLGERPVLRTLLGGAIILAAAAYSSIRKNA
ncbi:MAG: DMT family transporter, partial [Chloroflexota bacterium]